MPAKSKTAPPAETVSEDAIRQRAYFMWEADGRPDGRHDHYWHLAHGEASKAAAGEGNGAAKPAKAKAANGVEKPATKDAKAARPRAVKAAEPRAAKKATKPRAAVAVTRKAK